MKKTYGHRKSLARMEPKMLNEALRDGGASASFAGAVITQH
jgi:hypothetical protein